MRTFKIEAIVTTEQDELDVLANFIRHVGATYEITGSSTTTLSGLVIVNVRVRATEGRSVLADAQDAARSYAYAADISVRSFGKTREVIR